MDILRLRELKSELENDESYSEEQLNFAVNSVNRFIIAQQLNDREQEYYKNGYYFGYLLLASQRIENAVKVLIQNIYIKSGHNLSEEELNKPLGILLEKLFKKLECVELKVRLEQFKEVRDMVVHKLYLDSGDDLYEIERSIKDNMPLSKITRLQESLVILAAALSKEQVLGKIIKDKMQAEFGSEIPDYELK